MRLTVNVFGVTNRLQVERKRLRLTFSFSRRVNFQASLGISKLGFQIYNLQKNCNMFHVDTFDKVLWTGKILPLKFYSIHFYPFLTVRQRSPNTSNDALLEWLVKIADSVCFPHFIRIYVT